MPTAPSVSRRKHRLTRLGFHFLFVGGFAMLGGAIRGFNLLLVLAGLLVGVLLMQWRWSRRSLESLEAERRLPLEAFAGTPFRVSYRVSNRNRLMPTWMIRIEDPIKSIDGTIQATALGGIGSLSSGETTNVQSGLTVHRRGCYRFGPLSLVTTFPFALSSSRQITESYGTLHVFPKLVTLRKHWQQHLASRGGGVSTSVRRGGSVEGDFYGLREWQTGDSPKWIHWRTSARLSEPAVRQFEQQRRFDLCFLVDAFCMDEHDQEAAELAISLAATFLVHLIGMPSNRVVLAVAGKESETVIGGGSISGKRRMLEILARTQPSREPRLGEAACNAISLVGSTQDLVVISTRTLEFAKLAEPHILQTVTPWLRRGSCRWINVTESEINRWIARESNPRQPSKVASSPEKSTAPAATAVPAEVN